MHPPTIQGMSVYYINPSSMNGEWKENDEWILLEISVVTSIIFSVNGLKSQYKYQYRSSIIFITKLDEELISEKYDKSYNSDTF